MIVKLRQRFDRNNFKAGNQGRFSRVRFGHHNTLVSVGTSCRGHRQNPTRVTDNAVQREFTNDKGILDSLEGQASAQDDDAQRNRQIVSWAFLTDRGRSQIDNNAMTGEMQVSVLDGSLYTFTAFLYGCVW